MGGITAGSGAASWGRVVMAMTLRLSAAQAEGLRVQAKVEHASMQEVAKRAIDEYLAAHARFAPLELVLDAELARYGSALEVLARWTD